MSKAARVDVVVVGIVVAQVEVGVDLHDRDVVRPAAFGCARNAPIETAWVPPRTTWNGAVPAVASATCSTMASGDSLSSSASSWCAIRWSAAGSVPVWRSNSSI